MDVVIVVKGMRSSHCEKSVRDALLQLNGIHHVEIHLNEHIVNINYDHRVVSLEEICEQIEQQGYDVVR